MVIQRYFHAIACLGDVSSSNFVLLFVWRRRFAPSPHYQPADASSARLLSSLCTTTRTQTPTCLRRMQGDRRHQPSPRTPPVAGRRSKVAVRPSQTLARKRQLPPSIRYAGVAAGRSSRRPSSTTSTLRAPGPRPAVASLDGWRRSEFFGVAYYSLLSPPPNMVVWSYRGIFMRLHASEM